MVNISEFYDKQMDKINDDDFKNKVTPTMYTTGEAYEEGDKPFKFFMLEDIEEGGGLNYRLHHCLKKHLINFELDVDYQTSSKIIPVLRLKLNNKVNKKEKIMSEINENSIVKVHYTGKYDNGEVFDSSVAVEGTQFTDKEAITVELGKGMVIPGFEDALKGMKQGEKKTVTIESSQAYGDVLPERFQEIEKKFVPENIQVGALLTTQTEHGPMNVVVSEVKDETVVINGNNPLAGKDLTFDLEIVSFV
tara:strand:+ start:7602 stop:8348 length:747 start_codon:yes stop_codon:yes gene_type:complete